MVKQGRRPIPLVGYIQVWWGFLGLWDCEEDWWLVSIPNIKFSPNLAFRVIHHHSTKIRTGNFTIPN